MPQRQSSFTSVTTAEYARIHGVSSRTARRRIAEDPNAYRVGNTWRALVPTAKAAKARGVSVSTLRRRSQTVTTSDPMTLKLNLATPTKRQQAQERYFAMLNGRDLSATTIAKRSKAWTDSQINTILKAATFNDLFQRWDDYETGGGQNSLFYHDE